MLVYCEIAYISLLSENDQIFAKIVKNIVFSRTSSFFDFSNKKKRTLFFYEKFKTGPGFEIGQPQWKCQRGPTLQSMANPAVFLTFHFEHLGPLFWLGSHLILKCLNMINDERVPARAESIFGGWCWTFLANSGHFCDWKPMFDLKFPSWALITIFRI